jgi:hypothetical protein
MGNPPIRRRVIEPITYDPVLPNEAQQRAARLAQGRVVIVCGGRDYRDRARVFAALDRAHAREPITLVVHGACEDPKTRMLSGADRWADEWARERGVDVEPHPANWDLWKRSAGPMRNSQMARAGAHGCIAFPGGNGTQNMVRNANQHNIPVWRPFG